MLKVLMSKVNGQLIELYHLRLEFVNVFLYAIVLAIDKSEHELLVLLLQSVALDIHHELNKTQIDSLVHTYSFYLILGGTENTLSLKKSHYRSHDFGQVA